MSNIFFVLVSAVIFLTEYLLSILWPLLLQVELFVIWALAEFFLDRVSRLNGLVFLSSAIFFDLWSGGPFGSLTLALLLTMLVIFLVKKIMFTESRRNFTMLLWLISFYYLFTFLNAIVQTPIERFILPKFSFSGLVGVISWTVLIMIIRLAYEKKRVSHSRLRR